MRIHRIIRENVRMSRVNKFKILLKLIGFLLSQIEWKQQPLSTNELKLVMKEQLLN